MRFKHYYSFLFLSFLPLFGEQEALLSSLKQESLRLQKEKNSVESDILEFNWINPVMGSWSNTTNDQLGTNSKTNLYAITLEQPIFKSGGIYYAIAYAKANRAFLELSTKIEEQNLLKEAMNALLLLQKQTLQIEKQQFLIQNSAIDVMRKREQFERGLIDSSFLDQALLAQNTQEKTLLDLQTNLENQKMRFANISDMNPLHVSLPVFVLVDEKTYINHSLSIAQSEAGLHRSEHLKSLTLSSYLPSVSLVAGYYKSDNDVLTKRDNEYTSYGLKVSMPLFDINRAKNIESKKLDYLKSHILMEDTKRTEKHLYENTRKQLLFLEQKIALSKRDAALYASLIVSTKEGVQAGDKTIYDVQTLENSYRSIVLDEAILEYEKQLLLLELSARMEREI